MAKGKTIFDNLTGPPAVDLPLSLSPVHHLETLEPTTLAQDDQGHAPQGGSSALPEGNSDRSESSGGDNSEK